jgi:hypothetical protein
MLAFTCSSMYGICVVKHKGVFNMDHVATFNDTCKSIIDYAGSAQHKGFTPEECQKLQSDLDECVRLLYGIVEATEEVLKTK